MRSKTIRILKRRRNANAYGHGRHQTESSRRPVSLEDRGRKPCRAQYGQLPDPQHNDGKFLNADINGAGNILRKAYPYAFDGVDMEYLCGAVSAITGEQILHKKHKAPVKHYRRHRSIAWKVRHFYRQGKRMQLRMVWENRDDSYKKKNRPPAKAAA